MPDIEISIDDHGLITALGAWPQLQTDALRAGIRDAADAVLARSQDMVPVDTGTLKKSGNVRYGDMEATVGYNTSYAAFVHEGTASHIITPRTKKWLRWEEGRIERLAARISPRRAKWRFAKIVVHPGTLPQPYLSEALLEVRPQIREMVLRRLRAAWQDLRGAI